MSRSMGRWSVETSAWQMEKTLEACGSAVANPSRRFVLRPTRRETGAERGVKLWLRLLLSAFVAPSPPSPPSPYSPLLQHGTSSSYPSMWSVCQEGGGQVPLSSRPRRIVRTLFPLPRSSADALAAAPSPASSSTNLTAAPTRTPTSLPPDRKSVV